MSGQGPLSLDALAERVGRPLGRSRPIRVGQAEIDRFAEATGDRQWIHVDVERATAEIGGTIAHGYLTLSLVPQVVADVLEIEGVARRINYGLEKVRFPAPLPAGSEVTGEVRLVALSRSGEAWRMELEVTIGVEGAARPACVAHTITLLYPTPGGDG